MLQWCLATLPGYNVNALFAERFMAK